jgi:hypothetical protein
MIAISVKNFFIATSPIEKRYGHEKYIPDLCTAGLEKVNIWQVSWLNGII